MGRDGGALDALTSDQIKIEDVGRGYILIDDGASRQIFALSDLEVSLPTDKPGVVLLCHHYVGNSGAKLAI